MQAPCSTADQKAAGLSLAAVAAFDRKYLAIVVANFSCALQGTARGLQDHYDGDADGPN